MPSLFPLRAAGHKRFKTVRAVKRSPKVTFFKLWERYGRNPPEFHVSLSLSAVKVLIGGDNWRNNPWNKDNWAVCPCSSFSSFDFRVVEHTHARTFVPMSLGGRGNRTELQTHGKIVAICWSLISSKEEDHQRFSFHDKWTPPLICVGVFYCLSFYQILIWFVAPIFKLLIYCNCITQRSYEFQISL